MNIILVTTVPRRVPIQTAMVLAWETEAAEGASSDFRDMVKIAQTHFHRRADFKAWRGTLSARPALMFIPFN
jgi:hypothetical protein